MLDFKTGQLVLSCPSFSRKTDSCVHKHFIYVDSSNPHVWKHPKENFLNLWNSGVGHWDGDLEWTPSASLSHLSACWHHKSEIFSSLLIEIWMPPLKSFFFLPSPDSVITVPLFFNIKSDTPEWREVRNIFFTFMFLQVQVYYFRRCLKGLLSCFS